jgi:hypothetical protein
MLKLATHSASGFHDLFLNYSFLLSFIDIKAKVAYIVYFHLRILLVFHPEPEVRDKIY